MAVKILFFTLFLSLLSSPSSSSISNQTLISAAETLSDSGYFSMSLTLQSSANSIAPLSQSQSLTIFFPSDSAFSHLGGDQPSFSLLLFHFSPSSFPLHSLKSLPPGSKIPTLFSNHSLVVTSNGDDDAGISIHGVKISGSPIYDDGALVIFGIDEFFDPGLNATTKIQRPAWNNQGCSATDGGSDGLTSGSKSNHSFVEAVGVMRSNGYSFMASFLAVQLTEFSGSTGLTLFAPIDTSVNCYAGDFYSYPFIFQRHLVPSRILSSDLRDGVVLQTSMEGFGIRTRRSGNNVLLNDVQVSFPDMYNSSWLVVHGVRGMLDTERNRTHSESVSKIGRKIEVSWLMMMMALLVFSVFYRICFFVRLCW